MNLIAKIQFLDYWHLSSSQNAGSSHDSIAMKDENDIPFIPGKTLKGLIRQRAELSEDKDFVNTCFGYSSDKEDKFYDEVKKGSPALCYFSNAFLEESTKQEIIKNKLQNNLYDKIANTKINENGISVDDSLREIEVVIPLTLYAKIENLPSQYKDLMIKAIKSVKQMGLNRNRGLGRCLIEVEEEK